MWLTGFKADKGADAVARSRPHERGHEGLAQSRSPAMDSLQIKAAGLESYLLLIADLTMLTE